MPPGGADHVIPHRVMHNSRERDPPAGLASQARSPDWRKVFGVTREKDVTESALFNFPIHFSLVANDSQREIQPVPQTRRCDTCFVAQAPFLDVSLGSVGIVNRAEHSDVKARAR